MRIMPAATPSISRSFRYEEYLEFHRKYYHPSNSYIYLYGDMDIAEKFQWLDEQYLSGYGSRETDSPFPCRNLFCAVKEVIREYPVASGEPEEDQTYLSYNVAAGTLLDATLYQALDILDYALVSAPGAPVEKGALRGGDRTGIFPAVTITEPADGMLHCGEKYKSFREGSFCVRNL